MVDVMVTFEPETVASIGASVVEFILLASAVARLEALSEQQLYWTTKDSLPTVTAMLPPFGMVAQQGWGAPGHMFTVFCCPDPEIVTEPVLGVPWGVPIITVSVRFITV